MNLIILDYGIGNLRSVQKAFEKIGTPALISNDLQQIAEADRLVLPGVGAFGDCMAKFDAAQLRAPVLDHLRQEKPFLGICVGMQMLFTTSHENGIHQGLNIFPGEVKRFPTVAGYKVPHMGWNQAVIKNDSGIWKSLPSNWFYFVHSYYCEPHEATLTTFETNYIHPFCAGIQRDRLLATQFHPEKSQAAGLALLKAFVEM